MKRLDLYQLEALTRKLELLSGASSDETQQLIEGKLLELEQELRNVQVVVKDGKQIFLVDDDGVIVSTEHMSNKCMSQVHVGDISEHRRDDEIDHVGYLHTSQR